MLQRRERDAVAGGRLPRRAAQPPVDQPRGERVSRSDRIFHEYRQRGRAVHLGVGEHERTPAHRRAARPVAHRECHRLEIVTHLELTRRALRRVRNAEDETRGVIAGDEHVDEAQQRLLRFARTLRIPQLLAVIEIVAHDEPRVLGRLQRFE